MKGMGWIPDVPDYRDTMYSRSMITRILPLTLPSKVDLRDFCPPVYDQGELGSCTANSVCGLCDFLRNKNGWKLLNPSRLFLYYNTRSIEGTVDIDSGASLRNTIKSVNEFGVCREALWPYAIDKFSLTPETKAFEEAEAHQALEYQRITQKLNDMKGILAEGFPFVLGFSVYNSLYNVSPLNEYTLEFPKAGDDLIGGHAVLAVGYDDTTATFLIRNSWGEKWGDKGYFKIPYDYLTSPLLAQDFWTIKLVENGFEETT